jgi:hypothetical protein
MVHDLKLCLCYYFSICNYVIQNTHDLSSDDDYEKTYLKERVHEIELLHVYVV